MTSHIDAMIAAGAVGTVGDLLEGREPTPAEPVENSSPNPVREGYAIPFPEPGIYFGMDDETYHAIPALSASGVKKLASSPMLFWASSRWLGRKEETAEEDREFQTLGKAYHCRILEGRDEFNRRFAVGLNRADYPDVLESTDEIKNAIVKLGGVPVVKVATGEEVVGYRTATKEDLVAQLAALSTEPAPKTIPLIKDAIAKFGHEPVSRMETGETVPLTRPAKKEDWIDQLLELDPEAQVWARIEQAHAQANAGRAFISAQSYEQLAIAAMMIERDEDLSKAFRGGHPEVSLFWICGRTGVRMKARADYLKIRAIVDLKTVANQQEMSIERAIAREVATRKYAVQPSVYFEGAEVVRELVRKHGASAVHVWGEKTEEQQAETVAWALRWAQHREKDEFLFVFQQKGIAPVTRGLHFPRGGTTKVLIDDLVLAMKRRYRAAALAYGAGPWLDLAPIYDLADEDLPPYATEI